MAAEYTTKDGDCWDMIALEVYGSELHADVLMKANPQHIDTYRFDNGVRLAVPDISEQNQTIKTPFWRR